MMLYYWRNARYHNNYDVNGGRYRACCLEQNSIHAIVPVPHVEFRGSQIWYAWSIVLTFFFRTNNALCIPTLWKAILAEKHNLSSETSHLYLKTNELSLITDKYQPFVLKTTQQLSTAWVTSRRDRNPELLYCIRY